MDDSQHAEPANPSAREAEGLPPKSYAAAAHESEHTARSDSHGHASNGEHHTKVLKPKHSNHPIISGPAPVLKMVPDEEFERKHAELGKAVKTHGKENKEEQGHEPIVARQHAKKGSHGGHGHGHTKNEHKHEAEVNGHNGLESPKASDQQLDGTRDLSGENKVQAEKQVKDAEEAAKRKEMEEEKQETLEKKRRQEEEEMAKRREAEATAKAAEEESYAKKRREVEARVAEAKRKMAEDEKRQKQTLDSADKAKGTSQQQEDKNKQHDAAEEKNPSKQEKQDEEDREQAQTMNDVKVGKDEVEFSKKAAESKNGLEQTLLGGLGHEVANLKGEAELQEEFPEREGGYLTSTKMPDSYPEALKQDLKEAKRLKDELVSGKQAGAGWQRSA